MPKTSPKINTEAAERAVFFIEHLKLSTGEWAGKPVHLMDWQKDFLARFFGTLNKDGARQYRTLYLEVPRKNTKTESGAFCANYLLFADDEPGAQIYSAAGDRGQASLVYNAAAPMVRQSPALAKRAKIIDSQRRIVVYSTNSFYQVLSAEAYTKHGLNAHGVLFDELHTQPNRDLWDVLTTSTGVRRQPAIIAMTTAGYDRNTIAWEIHDYACKVRDGVIIDPTFLPVIYAADEKDDWTDEDVWKACNPAMAYGVRSIDEMRVMCKRAQETPALEMTFRRLYLNQWVNSVERWMPLDKWDACGGKINREDLRGRPCYAGLDLSSNIDLTALCLVFPMGEGRYTVLPQFWIPEDTAREKERKDRVPYQLWERQGFVKYSRGNVIDYRFILQELLDLRSQYDIREIAFDPWNNSQIAQDMKDDGFTVVDFRQGFRSMSGPTKDLMNTVLTGNLQHGGHPVLRWNADNLVVEQDAAGNLKPDKAKATQKIDGMVALIMALDRAVRHSGETGPSVYESRGPLVF
jgi:phage terminase large subunit-like protein